MTRSIGSAHPYADVATWAAVRAGAPELPLPAAGSRVIVISAHADDETLGAGGFIARAAAGGAELTVVVASDGAGSHPQSTTTSPDELVAVRRAEVRAAVAVLDPQAEVVLLGLPDGRLAQMREQLRAALRPLLAGCDLALVPWSHDGHPDHDVCGELVRELLNGASCDVWEYPIWAWQWASRTAGDLPVARLGRIELGAAERAVKARALEQYASQLLPLSGRPGDEAVLTPAMLAHFRGSDEVFLTSS